MAEANPLGRGGGGQVLRHCVATLGGLVQQSEALDDQLCAEAVITGQVTDRQGRSIQDAELRVYTIDPLGAVSTSIAFADPEKLDLHKSRLAPVAKTDANGKVTISGLPHDERIALNIKHVDYRRDIIFVSDLRMEPQPDIETFDYVDGKADDKIDKGLFGGLFGNT